MEKFDLPDTKDSKKRKLLINMSLALGIIRETILTPLRWLTWRLWGRRQATSRLKQLAGLDSKYTAKDLSLERSHFAGTGMIGRGPTITPEDAHLEHYNMKHEKLPPPDADDSGLN